ncbi:MAG TPA: DNA replication protein [Alphaproteobacteria bacterium]|nr:DNA replication protein [Alphaproteobacteria bacterium]
MGKEGPRQLALRLPHRAALGAEDFLVAASNAEAVAWLDRWPDWGMPGLALHGPEGCGKTHLLRVWRARSGASLIQPADLAALEFAALADRPQPIALDACIGPLPERELLHLYNLLAAGGRHILLAGRDPPSHWPIALADLRSRLGALPAVAIAPPDDVLLAGILVKLFADRQLRVEAAVIDYLLARMERSFAAAERLVGRLDTLALQLGRRVTIGLARVAIDEEEEE